MINNYYRVNPSAIYETPKDGVIKVLSVAGTGAAATANLSLVAAVTGKRIRVMGWRVSGLGAAIGYFILKNGSGGTFIALETVPTNASGFISVAPIVDAGYCETDINTALVVDTGPQGLNYTFFYILYTP